MIKKITFSLFFLFSLALLPVSAQQATPANSLTDKIKERLQESAEEGLDAIKQTLSDKPKAPRKKAYVGSLVSVTEASIVLQYKGESLTVNFDDDTKILQISGGRKSLDAQDLETDDFLLAFGFVYPDNGSLQAVEIQRITKPEAPAPRQLISGSISEIDGTKLTVNNKEITIAKNTDFVISKIEDPKLDMLALDDYLFAIVTLDNNGDIDVINSVLVFPGKNNPLGSEPTNSDTATTSAETDIEEVTEE
jgi:hypothetical protein